MISGDIFIWVCIFILVVDVWLTLFYFVALPHNRLIFDSIRNWNVISRPVPKYFTFNLKVQSKVKVYFIYYIYKNDKVK